MKRNAFEEVEGAEEIRRFYELASIYFAKNRIKEKGPDSQKDIAECERLEKAWGEPDETKKMATVLEYFIHQGIEDFVWLGGRVSCLPASRYDDYHNGIDLILEIEEEDEDASKYVGVGVDASFGSDSAEAKIRANFEKVASGVLGQIKYFESPIGEEQNPKSDVPKVVVGVDVKTIHELMGLFGAKADSFRDRLRTHQIKNQITCQILEQLRAYAEIFSAISDPRAKEIEETLLVLAGLGVDVDSTEADFDGVHYRILEMTKKYKKYFLAEIKSDGRIAA